MPDMPVILGARAVPAGLAAKNNLTQNDRVRHVMIDIVLSIVWEAQQTENLPLGYHCRGLKHQIMEDQRRRDKTRHYL